MREEFAQLIDGNFTQAHTTLMTDRLGDMWPAIPFIALILVIRLTTKNDAVTAFACIIGILAMKSSEITLSVVVHPFVYAVAVVSMATFLYRVFK